MAAESEELYNRLVGIERDLKAKDALLSERRAVFLFPCAYAGLRDLRIALFFVDRAKEYLLRALLEEQEMEVNPRRQGFLQEAEDPPF